MAELEKVHTRILLRIADLELAHLPKQHSSYSPSSPNSAANSTTESRLSGILRSKGVKDFSFKRVPSDYYDRPLESRRDILGAPSVHHLCKSIVLEMYNTFYFTMPRNNPSISLSWYSARLNADCEELSVFAQQWQNTKKEIQLAAAPEEISQKFTGYEHNGVTCIGMKTNIPVILDEAIVRLDPDFFWLGSGEIDLKLGIRTSEFVDCLKPFIVNCSGT